MPLISALYTSVLTVLILALGYWVTRVRHSERVGLGLGESKPLEKAVRIHGNAVENVPLAMLLLLLVEMSGYAPWVIHALGASVVVARLLHISGIMKSRGVSFGRFWGMALTWTAMGVMATLNVIAHFRG